VSSRPKPRRRAAAVDLTGTRAVDRWSFRPARERRGDWASDRPHHVVGVASSSTPVARRRRAGRGRHLKIASPGRRKKKARRREETMKRRRGGYAREREIEREKRRVLGRSTDANQREGGRKKRRTSDPRPAEGQVRMVDSARVSDRRASRGPRLTGTGQPSVTRRPGRAAKCVTSTRARSRTSRGRRSAAASPGYAMARAPARARNQGERARVSQAWGSLGRRVCGVLSPGREGHASSRPVPGLEACFLDGCTWMDKRLLDTKHLAG